MLHVANQRIAPVGNVQCAVAADLQVSVSDLPGLDRLADAVERKDREGALALIQEGVDVNAAQVDGMTALHWAAYLDDLEAKGPVRLGAAGAWVPPAVHVGGGGNGTYGSSRPVTAAQLEAIHRQAYEEGLARGLEEGRT